MGMLSACRRKAARARPVATAKRPPWSIQYRMASRFRGEMGGRDSPSRRAASVKWRVLS